MEKIRRQQLIEATLESIELHGLHGTTIVTISKLAGVSSGIISHYFGGKQALIEATVKYLLFKLHEDLLNNLSNRTATPKERLYAIVEANFSHVQQSNRAAVTWLSFWAQSMHSDRLARIQRVNALRLTSNLKYSFKALVTPKEAEVYANMVAAQIDGFWLRAALSKSNVSYQDAERTCKLLIDTIVRDNSSL